MLERKASATVSTEDRNRPRRRYSEQFAFVGTRKHYELIQKEMRAQKLSKAAVVRAAVEHYFNCATSGHVEKDYH